jgi:hypothetical protein
MSGNELSEQEIFERVRESFIASAKMTDEDIEAAMALNRALHTHTCEDLFRVLR